MSSNPGHYVGLVVTSPTMRTENGLPLKQLKLLRADDTLLIGHVYRLAVEREWRAWSRDEEDELNNPSPLSNPDNSNSITVNDH
ncbi:hypothetical protein Peur_060375 [Populus x canadensis]